MKFLIIGNGFIAPKHKKAIKEIGGEVVDIIDIDRGENAWEEGIRSTNADCVVILTPNDLHYPICKLAAERGKIVLCEKPLAIKSCDAKDLARYQNIFSVLQLRYHPDIEKIKKNIKSNGKNEIQMDISVYRDKKYYSGWKGNIKRSGGPLFNLGIHYFDILIYLFGESKHATLESLDEKIGIGVIEGDNYICHFKVSTGADRKNQKRVYKINGENYNFSSKDNLSFENLHIFVYRDLLRGRGVLPGEALKAIALIENLYNSYGK